MSVPLILTFVSTVVFAIQFLIVVDLYNHISVLIRDNPRAGPGSTGTSPSIRRCRALSSTAIRSIQVLWNGRGRLSLEVIRQNGDVALTVSDTGQGIPPDNLCRLFEPCYSGKPNGLGLDLAIARRITRARGGRNGR